MGMSIMYVYRVSSKQGTSWGCGQMPHQQEVVPCMQGKAQQNNECKGGRK